MLQEPVCWCYVIYYFGFIIGLVYFSFWLFSCFGNQLDCLLIFIVWHFSVLWLLLCGTEVSSGSTPGHSSVLFASPQVVWAQFFFSFCWTADISPRFSLSFGFSIKAVFSNRFYFFYPYHIYIYCNNFNVCNLIKKNCIGVTLVAMTLANCM